MSRTLLVWLVLSLIWGSTWTVVKIGVSDLPPFNFALMRFLMALAPLWFLFWLRKSKLPQKRSEWITIWWSGLLYFPVNYALVFFAGTLISSALSAVLYTTMPLFGLLLAHYFMENDRITSAKLFGVLVGFSGVLLIFSNQLALGGMDQFWGILAVIGASLGSSAGGVVVKRGGAKIDAISLTTCQLTVGMMPMVILAFVTEGPVWQMNWTGELLWAAAYLGFVGTALTFVLLNWLTKHMDISKVMLIPFGSTFVAILLGWVVLGENWHIYSMIGAVMITGGLLLSVQRRRLPVFAR